jgi:hypothetical protein
MLTNVGMVLVSRVIRDRHSAAAHARIVRSSLVRRPASSNPDDVDAVDARARNRSAGECPTVVKARSQAIWNATKMCIARLTLA